MAVRCWRTDCIHNTSGWCDLYYIEIDENGKCIDYMPKIVLNKEQNKGQDTEGD